MLFRIDAAQVTGGGERTDKIQQRVGDGEIYEHFHPPVNHADDNQQNGRFGGDDVGCHDPVNRGWTGQNPVEYGEHQRKYGHPRK